MSKVDVFKDPLPLDFFGSGVFLVSVSILLYFAGTLPYLV